MTRQTRNTAIEKNRTALLRLLFWWLATLKCFNTCYNRPLPQRFAQFVEALLCKVEKAYGLLLFAACYKEHRGKIGLADMQIIAENFAASNKRFTCASMSIYSVIQRVERLQYLLVNLRTIARCIVAKLAYLWLSQTLKHNASALVFPNNLTVDAREVPAPP